MSFGPFPSYQRIIAPINKKSGVNMVVTQDLWPIKTAAFVILHWMDHNSNVFNELIFSCQRLRMEHVGDSSAYCKSG